MIDYDGLNRLAYQIKTETGRAANTALRVGTLFEDIIDALKEGDNTGLLDQITNLKNDISKIINMIKDLNTEIDTSIITRIEANERNISNINNTIQGINTTISSIQGDINTINGTLSNHTTLIDGLQGQITTINNSITEIGTQISNITNTISTITSDLTALTTRVSTNETNIAELKKRLDAIDLDPIIAAINKLNVDLTALTSRVSSAELEINALNEFTSALSRQITEEIDRATAAEEALDKKFNDYLPLAGGTMTGDIHFSGTTAPVIDLLGDSIHGCLAVKHPNEAYRKTILRYASGITYVGDSEHGLRIDSSGMYRDHNNTLYEIWREDNDGSGSGLDADLLDGHHWSEISSAVSGYLPLAGGTMTGTIVLPKSSNNSHLGIAAGPSSSDVFLGYDDISNFFGSTNKVTEVLGPVISIGASSRVSVGSNDEVSVIAVNKLFLQGASQLVMKTPTIYWTTDSTDGMKLISNKTNIGFDVFNTTYDPTLLVKTKVKLKTASSGSTSYEMLHEGNSVFVVSSYPTDLSSYPDGAIFIKTS